MFTHTESRCRPYSLYPPQPWRHALKASLDKTTRSWALWHRMSSSINVARSWSTCPPCKPLSINLWRIRHSHSWKPSLDLSLSLASISMDMWMSQTSLDRKVTNSLSAGTLSWTSNLELQDVIVRQKPSWTPLTSYGPWSSLSLCLVLYVSH